VNDFNETDCRRARKLLLDRALARSPGATIPEGGAAHLRDCPSCARYEESMRIAPRLFSTGPLYGAALRRRTLERVETDTRSRDRRLAWLVAPVAALVLLVSFVLPGWLLSIPISNLVESQLLALALGLFIALISVSVGQALAVAIPLADLLIIGLGVLLLLNRNPFKRLPQIQVPILSNPYANAFVYGLLYGPIALPCSGPLVVGIFALSLTAGEALGKLNVFLWFGLGFGLPLLLLSFLSGAAQRWITRQFAVHARKINIAAGVLLVGIGIYDLWSNWELIQAFLT